MQDGSSSLVEKARDVLASLKLREGPAVKPEVVNELKDALDRFVQANYLPLLIN